MYIINGDPIPLARARFGKGRAWDAQKRLKLMLGIELSKQHLDQPLYYGALHLDVVFYMTFAKSTPQKTRDKFVNKPHIFKPDLSNLIKFIEDVAQGIIYKDDCIIASVFAKKIYDNNPRTEFTIKQLVSNET